MDEQRILIVERYRLMSTDGMENTHAAEDMSKVQSAVVVQLFQVIAKMRHIDELFQWLAYVMIQHFDMHVAQLWANQIDQAGRFTVQLRTAVHRDPSIPEIAVINDQIAYVALSVISEQRSYKPQPVEMFFPSYRAAVLRRYGLNYCSICFTSGNAGLPPPEGQYVYERTPAPLALSTLLFMRQLPHPDFMYTISALLDQAVALAGNCGLLLPLTVSPSLVIPSPKRVAPSLRVIPSPWPVASPLTPRLQPIHSLEHLIPRRKQNADLLLADNPFASTAIIADKRVRRFYASIDGHTDVFHICSITGMNNKEAYMALQMLLKQQYIEIYDPSGRLIDMLPTE